MSGMLKKMVVSYDALERLLHLPVGVIIAGVKEGSVHKVAEIVLVDQYDKLSEDCNFDFETMQWVPYPHKGQIRGA